MDVQGLRSSLQPTPLLNPVSRSKTERDRNFSRTVSSFHFLPLKIGCKVFFELGRVLQNTFPFLRELYIEKPVLVVPLHRLTTTLRKRILTVLVDGEMEILVSKTDLPPHSLLPFFLGDFFLHPKLNFSCLYFIPGGLVKFRFCFTLNLLLKLLVLRLDLTKEIKQRQKTTDMTHPSDGDTGRTKTVVKHRTNLRVERYRDLGRLTLTFLERKTLTNTEKKKKKNQTCDINRC